MSESEYDEEEAPEEVEFETAPAIDESEHINLPKDAAALQDKVLSASRSKGQYIDEENLGRT